MSLKISRFPELRPSSCATTSGAVDGHHGLAVRACHSAAQTRSLDILVISTEGAVSSRSVFPHPALFSHVLSDALFSHSIQLLPLLNNPLNLELLSRHILQSPAIWVDGTQDSQRYLRIVSGFRASLGWKVKDLAEWKGGVSVDEWIVAIGRGAIGNGRDP